MKTTIINEKELKNMLDAKEDFLLLDVLPPEYFAEKHIPEAQNAPVYEVTFLTYLEKLGVSKDKKIVVYNESENSLATQDAAIKLEKAGYENILEFPGGLSRWEKAGYEIEKGEAIPDAEILDGEYKLDTESSLIGWSGRNAKYAHHGKIKVKEGAISIKDRKIVGGKIILDMTTIKDEDLTDDMWRGILESHLKSSDFFEVESFPEASFELKRATELVDAKIGTPNYDLEGGLVIKDVNRPIEFPAMIVPMGDGVLNGQAHFDFDRTLWNVRYGSEKFFEKLGMHLVNDVVSLELFLVAKK